MGIKNPQKKAKLAKKARQTNCIQKKLEKDKVAH